MLNQKDLAFIAAAVDVKLFQANNVIEMLMEGNTVPFISRYRKEKTDDLDELKVLHVSEQFIYVKELNERKETVLKTIEGQGKLTAELKKKIEDTYSKTELEDIYLPYKPKRRTKATIAREKGLEPLALAIWDASVPGVMEDMAVPFVSEEKQVLSVAEALEGAGHILAEMISEQADLRRDVRHEVAELGKATVAVTPEFKEERTKFEQYYEYTEPVKQMPSHRILAIRRGETEKVLRIKIDCDQERIQTKFRSMVFVDNHPRFDFLNKVLEDALERLLLPSIEQDIRSEMKKRADEEAINVFAANLEKLLLSPSAGNLKVIGADPGFRSGVKLVALDETGKLLETVTIYPTKPQERVEESKAVVDHLIAKHGIQAVAIGNGTASRETLAFFKSIVPQHVIVCVISEAGASVYSASEAGREEFPEYDVTVRGAVSIGRRFQDALAELVKIEPKSIGVGQYQHDVNQPLLKSKLDQVVELVVNRVGVELNTASYHLLKYVSGIGPTLAKNIVQYRNDNGMFKSREEVNQVRMFGAKAFQQSAGFLRIRGAANPLDATGIHPESYFIVEKMCQNAAVPVTGLVCNKALIATIKPEEYVNEQFGLPTVHDIIKELETPGRDPRQDFVVFEFEDGVEKIEDLHEGMVLRGVVTNVTKFGAFVDIGVHQDGLVHISELSNRYITNPEEVIAVEDKVRVKVLSIDEKLKRIQLSIKALLEPPTIAPKERKTETEHKPKPPHQKPNDRSKPHDRQQDRQKEIDRQKQKRDTQELAKKHSEDLLNSLKAKWGAKG